MNHLINKKYLNNHVIQTMIQHHDNLAVFKKSVLSLSIILMSTTTLAVQVIETNGSGGAIRTQNANVNPTRL